MANENEAERGEPHQVIEAAADAAAETAAIVVAAETAAETAIERAQEQTAAAEAGTAAIAAAALEGERGNRISHLEGEVLTCRNEIATLKSSFETMAASVTSLQAAPAPAIAVVTNQAPAKSSSILPLSERPADQQADPNNPAEPPAGENEAGPQAPKKPVRRKI